MARSRVDSATMNLMLTFAIGGFLPQYASFRCRLTPSSGVYLTILYGPVPMVRTAGVPIDLPCFWEKAFWTMKPACAAGTYWKAVSAFFILIVIVSGEVALIERTLA